MEVIANDPIISFYMKMSNPTDSDTEMPLFSETMLRLSFKQIFGSVRPVSPKELLLYRRILLFNFSENYPSITDLIAIMTCFSEEEIRECFDKHESIIDQWHKFMRAFIFPIVFRDALNELLCEYARRYCILFGQIDEDSLKLKASEILMFLRYDNKLPRQWYRIFNNLFQNRTNAKNDSEQYQNLKTDDLKIANIYSDVKDRLNVLVVDEMAKYDNQNEVVKEPDAKKLKPNELNIIEVELLSSTNLDQMIESDAKSSQLQVNTSADDEVHDIDSEIQIINSADLDEEINESNDSEVGQNESVITEENTQEILQQVVIVNADDGNDEGDEDDVDDEDDKDDNDIDDDDEDESEYQYHKTSVTEETNHDDIDENTDYVEIHNDAKPSTSESSHTDAAGAGGVDGKAKRGILSKDTALSYIAALQAYVVVNGHFQAIELLDKVDSLLRENYNK